jgi:hypothetical protein
MTRPVSTNRTTGRESAVMSEIPDDIKATAEACYLECEQMDSYGIIKTIGKYLAAERNAQVPAPDGELQYPFSDGRSMTKYQPKNKRESAV